MDPQTAIKAEFDRIYGALHAYKMAITYLFAAAAKEMDDPKAWLNRAADELTNLLDKPISGVEGTAADADATLSHARDFMEMLQDTLKNHVL